MKENRFTTRLELEDSKSIVDMYYRRYKKKNLQLIIPFLEKIIHNYDKYEWIPEKIEEYRVKEKKEIEENHAVIERVISQSFELHFGRE